LGALGTGTRTATTVPPTTSTPTRGGSSSSGADAGRSELQAAKLSRLEARVRELEAETTKLSTEREILRPAAKYFAGETNW
jgi:transposase